MTTLEGSPLGKSTGYPERYDPALLFPIARSDARQALGLTSELPFGGADLWTAYEISWLDALGKPQLAIGRFRIPADSPRIVESKSLKLYLGSFAQEHAVQTSELVRRIEADLARACGAAVGRPRFACGCARHPHRPVARRIAGRARNHDRCL